MSDPTDTGPTKSGSSPAVARRSRRGPSRDSPPAGSSNVAPRCEVTLCLPLFLAGNEGERNFARLTRR